MERWRLEGDSRANLVWAKQYSHLFSFLSFNIVREVCTYLPPFLTLALVQEDSVSFFNFTTLTFHPAVQLNTTVQVNHNSTWAVVNRNILVLCGGGGKSTIHIENGQAWHSAYLLHSEGQVRALPDCLYGRSGSGVVVWKGAVHVFGSRSYIAGKRCERLSLSRGSNWQALPLLANSHYCFNPVVWKATIYICGGWCTSIEVWDGRTFSVLEPQLPSRVQSCISCTDRSQLYILGSSFSIALSKRSDTAAVCLEEFPHAGCVVHCCTSPMISGDTMYRLVDGEVMEHSVKMAHKA